MPRIAHSTALFAVWIFPGSPRAVRYKNPAQINMITDKAKKIGQTTMLSRLFATQLNQAAGAVASHTAAKVIAGSNNETVIKDAVIIFLSIYEKRTLLIIIGMETDKSATTTPIAPYITAVLTSANLAGSPREFKNKMPAQINIITAKAAKAIQMKLNMRSISKAVALLRLSML